MKYMFQVVDWNHLIRDRVQWKDFENTKRKFRIM
jgi:hypothetical protein